MATRSMGNGSRVGLIFTVFLLTGIKAQLLISWFNWIKFSLALTSHIQTPTYDSICPSHPQLSFSMGPEDNIFRNLISRGMEAEQGRDWMAYVCGDMWAVPQVSL